MNTRPRGLRRGGVDGSTAARRVAARGIGAIDGRRDGDRGPINVVPEGQPMVPVLVPDNGWGVNQSDPGPYPFPPGAGADRVKEQGNDTSCVKNTDCHILVVQRGSCMLWEAWQCRWKTSSPGAGGSGSLAPAAWHCGSGAKFNLGRNSYLQRPVGWTSADAAGLPMTPGVIRFDEAEAGCINHALRIVVGCTSSHFIKPATHGAKHPLCTQPDSAYPPLGLRFRL